MKLVRQTLRPDCLALGIYGSTEEIEGIELSLLNLGMIHSAESYRYLPLDVAPSKATPGGNHPYIGLHLGTPERFRYVLLSPDNLWAWLRHRASLRFDVDRVTTPSLEAWVWRQVLRAYDEIKTETFLHYGVQYFRPTETGRERKDREYAKREIAELAALA